MKNDLEENCQNPFANELVYLIRDNRFWMVLAATRGAAASCVTFNGLCGLFGESRWAVTETAVGHSSATHRDRAVFWEHEDWNIDEARKRVSTSIYAYYAILKEIIIYQLLIH